MNDMLRLVCYNIHGGKDRWGRRYLDQMAELLQTLEADVIALQEVHQNSRHGYQAEMLADRLQLSLTYAPALQLYDGAYGNALLSKFPMIRSVNIPLAAKREPRSLLKNTLQYGKHEIDVWVTHCSLDRESRRRQLSDIRREIGQLGSRPLLIAGDFNTASPPLCPPLQDCGAGEGASTPTLVTFSRRVDYVFASSDWQVDRYEVIQQKMSDHYPLLVTLTLPE
ncbi:endonuclease/exonuclease/phosphatase family protein [Brevibacillus humidisoli]|uniref:endonuclease/exonuclease/phosphatase family protein n=1 Tax=Brevibacillus humidisoli TaxID=2895522 RepID=UPI001E418283|nr:endonuclease/exonuclease/phosphatase family protein [Brevibacillus humidisoli]UFJ43119.1 endonuclease/exonuclease/phosphatase family protein [Brevibacillus humidisoli]